MQANEYKKIVEEKEMAEEMLLNKPLEKHTVKELKELALSLETIQGVSAMKKQELIDAIKTVKGIPLKKERDATVAGIPGVKRRIKELKVELAGLREQGSNVEATKMRKTISKLKKKTRRLARQLQ